MDVENARKKYREWKATVDGGEYRPFVTIRMPSNGVASRVKDHTVGRMHHLLSQPERRALLLIDFDPAVTDVREQYALDPDVTMEIADAIGVKHPSLRRSKEIVVMSTDLLVTYGENVDEGHLRAYSVKPREKLEEKRVLEKLEIERRYWEREGVQWMIVTDDDLKHPMVANIEWVYGRRLTSQVGLDQEEIGEILPRLFEYLQDGDEPLSESCRWFDEDHVLPPGQGLSLVRHALANRLWEIDWSTEITPVNEPLPDLKREAGGP